jgi:hypothetical protein
VLGRFSIFCSFVLRYFASLYEGACTLLITGLMGVPSLYILIYALRFGAARFLLMRYLLLSFSITRLHSCNVCWICVWYAFVGALLICVKSFSCRNVCIFWSRISRFIITTALLLSALFTISSSLRMMSFIWLMVCWILLYSWCCVCVSDNCFNLVRPFIEMGSVSYVLTV